MDDKRSHVNGKSIIEESFGGEEGEEEKPSFNSIQQSIAFGAAPFSVVFASR
jgi:hypothetical protein